MPLWQWVLDSAGVILALLLLYALLLVVRRRWISRAGGTFELSHRVPGRGWMLGTGRYSDDALEWFRVFSLSPRPKRRWLRGDLDFDDRREATGAERHLLYPGHVVICCSSDDGTIELALSPASLTGLQSWLEARRPGTDWSR